MNSRSIFTNGSILGGKYKVAGVLGSGGMGVVYQVVQIFHGKTYALKTLSEADFSETSARRFQREAKATSFLDHPNLVRLYDFGVLDSGEPYLVVDYIEGNTLADYLKSSGRLPMDQAIKVFAQVAKGLLYAHEHGVVHRDIKPANIMLPKDMKLDTEGSIKILDFGIAKLINSDLGQGQTLTKVGEIVGSPLYMSPEQCLGANIDHRSDIYSLGCVLFETLTGAPPQIGTTALNTMMMHQRTKPMSLKEASLGLDFPPIFETTVAKMLQKNADDRYQNLNQVLIDLNLADSSTGFRTESTMSSKRQSPDGEPKSDRFWVNKKLFLTVAFSSILSLVLGAGVDRYILSRNEARPPQSKLSTVNALASLVAAKPTNDVQILSLPRGSSIESEVNAKIQPALVESNTTNLNAKNLQREIIEQSLLIQNSNDSASLKVTKLEGLINKFKSSAEKGGLSLIMPISLLSDYHGLLGQSSDEDVHNFERCLSNSNPELKALCWMRIASVKGKIHPFESSTASAFVMADSLLPAVKNEVQMFWYKIERLKWLELTDKLREKSRQALADAAEQASLVSTHRLLDVRSDYLIQELIISAEKLKPLAQTTTTKLKDLLRMHIANRTEISTQEHAFYSTLLTPTAGAEYLEHLLSSNHFAPLDEATLWHCLLSVEPNRPINQRLGYARKAYALTKNSDHYGAHVISCLNLAQLLDQSDDHSAAFRVYEEGIALAKSNLNRADVLKQPGQISDLKFWLRSLSKGADADRSRGLQE